MNSKHKWVATIAASALLTSGLAATSTALASSGYVMTTKKISLNGQVMSQPSGFVYQKTTYIPIWYVQQVLKQLGIHSTWDGKNWRMTTPSTMTPDMSKISVGNGAGSIYLNNKIVKKVPSVVATDPSSHTLTTYMPIWYVMGILQRVNVGSNWTGTTWSMSSPNNFPAATPFSVVQKVDTVITNLDATSDVNQIAADLVKEGYMTQATSDEYLQDFDWSTALQDGVTKLTVSDLKLTKQVTTDPLQQVLEVSETDTVVQDGKTYTYVVVNDWTLIRDNTTSPWKVDGVATVSPDGGGSSDTGNTTDNSTGSNSVGNSTNGNSVDNSTNGNAVGNTVGNTVS